MIHRLSIYHPLNLPMENIIHISSIYYSYIIHILFIYHPYVIHISSIKKNFKMVGFRTSTMVFFPFRNDSSPVAQGHPGPKICSWRELFRWAMDDSSSMMYIYIYMYNWGWWIYISKNSWQKFCTSCWYKKKKVWT